MSIDIADIDMTLGFKVIDVYCRIEQRYVCCIWSYIENAMKAAYGDRAFDAFREIDEANTEEANRRYAEKDKNISVVPITRGKSAFSDLDLQGCTKALFYLNALDECLCAYAEPSGRPYTETAFWRNLTDKREFELKRLKKRRNRDRAHQTYSHPNGAPYSDEDYAELAKYEYAVIAALFPQYRHDGVDYAAEMRRLLDELEARKGLKLYPLNRLLEPEMYRRIDHRKLQAARSQYKVIDDGTISVCAKTDREALLKDLNALIETGLISKGSVLQGDPFSEHADADAQSEALIKAPLSRFLGDDPNNFEVDRWDAFLFDHQIEYGYSKYFDEFHSNIWIMTDDFERTKAVLAEVPKRQRAAHTDAKKRTRRKAVPIAAVSAAVLALVLVIVLIASNRRKGAVPVSESVETDAPTPIASAPQPLIDSSYDAWIVHGQFLFADGTLNDWGEDVDLYIKSAMTPIALEDVKAIDADVYRALSERDVRYLYKIDLIFGTNDAGWNVNCVIDGKLYETNGAYSFKLTHTNLIGSGNHTDRWIPDPWSANTESLTPQTLFIPSWQEDKDAFGFSWNNTPVVIGGAGCYTLIAARYNHASSLEQPGYGFALVQTEERDGFGYTELTPYVPFVPSEHSYAIVIRSEETGWIYGDGVEMQPSGDDRWTGFAELKRGDEFNIQTIDGSDFDWFFDCVCEADGIYGISVAFENGQATREIWNTAVRNFGLVGSFEGSNWGADGMDVLLTQVNSNLWTGSIMLRAGDEFMIRTDNNWDYCWGAEGRLCGESYRCEQDGVYDVTLRFTDGKADIAICLCDAEYPSA